MHLSTKNNTTSIANKIEQLKEDVKNAAENAQKKGDLKIALELRMTLHELNELNKVFQDLKDRASK